MTDSLETFSEIRQIRARIEAIEHTQEVLVRAHADSIMAEIWERMDADDILASVYLLVDGIRTQSDIVNALREADAAGASNASVSRKLDILHRELHLIELLDQNRTGKIYVPSAVDRILGIGRRLERRRSSTSGSPK